MDNTLYQKIPQVHTKKIIDFSNGSLDVLDDIITFSDGYKNYCVYIVDIVDSTKIIASLTKTKACKYYSIFLNSMAMIAKEFGGVVVKNIGDSLLYYFPDTSDSSNKKSFTDPLECGIEMINAREIINTKMADYELPPVSYRISADYGAVITAKSVNSYYDDIFGSSVNLCAKINTKAMPNTMVIGGDLYQIVKSFEEYLFKPAMGYSVGLKLQYPVYSVYRK